MSRWARTDSLFENPLVVGTITLLIAVVAVYVSYGAENGLPFLPSYEVSIPLRNADELGKNADVRVGGSRVGQVLTVTPEPAGPGHPQPYALAKLQLSRSLEPLPADTRYAIRVASILGGKYIELFPVARSGSGASVSDGGALPARDEIPTVDLDTAFRTFGPATQAGLRGAAAELAAALAGRGGSLNDAIAAVHRAIGPLSRLLAVLAAPSTRLPAFVAGAAATTGALAPAARSIGPLLAGGARTAGALDAAAPALGASIDALPGVEQVGSGVLRHAGPVLASAARLAAELAPAAPLVPAATGRLSQLVGAATPVFRRAPAFAERLDSALSALQRLAADPAVARTFALLGGDDLATLGSSAFLGLGAILGAVGPAQLGCNVAGIWARNLASTFSDGDATGTWIRAAIVLDSTLSLELPASRPSSNLHVTPYPVEGARQCQAGNQAYSSKQVIGSPGHTGRAFDLTTPPAGVLARGRAAGLVP